MMHVGQLGDDLEALGGAAPVPDVRAPPPTTPSSSTTLPPWSARLWPRAAVALDRLVLMREVVAPVLLEVAVADDRTHRSRYAAEQPRRLAIAA
jgi:hypothetical protein